MLKKISLIVLFSFYLTVCLFADHIKPPILEYDSNPKAIINPEDHYKPILEAEYFVICFFKETVEEIAKNHNAKVVANLSSAMGNFPIYQIEYKGKKVGFYLSPVGAPLAAGFMDELIALGYSKFIACGSAGVLNSEIESGKAIIPTSAIRDEGVSYHYLPPGREITVDTSVINIIRKTCDGQNVDYVLGKTWTTDAFYRETPAKVQNRKSDGCISVEMEASAFLAVAQFRKVKFGQILYAGDDVSKIKWDHRNYWDKASVREKLFWLAVESCIKL